VRCGEEERRRRRRRVTAGVVEGAVIRSMGGVGTSASGVARGARRRRSLWMLVPQQFLCYPHT
jgi:hypothetical protein